MKEQYLGNHMRGMSTIEIVLSFAILTLAISAVVILLFSNQSLTIDTQTNLEALNKAQTQLEEAKALAEADFLAVESQDPVTEDIYERKLDVFSRAECLKEAVSTVNWARGGRNMEVSLTSMFSDLTIALQLGGDCSPGGGGGWDNPQTAVSLGFGGQGSTDIDVRLARVYVTSDPSAANKDDLFILDFDADTLTLTTRSETDLGDGLVAIDVANTSAYALNEETERQLFVIDVADPVTPTLVGSSTIPSAPSARGRSIYYYDNKVYVGTQYMGCPPMTCDPSYQNNELHIYDVTDSATDPVWLGSVKVNHNVNTIIVRNGYAYVATSDDYGEVMVYDVSDPTDPTLQGVFDAPGDEDGTALYLLSNTLYLGRERVNGASEKDFYMLDVSDPTSDPVEIGSVKLGLNPHSEVKGVVVRDPLAFVAIDDSTKAFKILNTSNPLNIVDATVCTTINFSENTTALDMDGDFVFTANRSNDELRVIYDHPTACST